MTSAAIPQARVALPAPRRSATPAPRAASEPYRICCVCTGNICRSPMCEALLRARLRAAGLADRVVVDSAGTSDEEAGRAEHPATRRLLARRSVPLDGHRAREFRPGWIGRYDLVLAMDHPHLRVLRGYAERAGVDPDRVRLVNSDGIADPWGHPDAAYEDVFGQLDRAFDVLVPQLAALLGPIPSGPPVPPGPAGTGGGRRR